MTDKTITRIILAEAMHQKIGLSRNDCYVYIKDVNDMIADALANGDEVKLPKFGSFSVRQKKERIGRNPKTNEKAVISARKVVVFKPSLKLKDRVTDELKEQVAVRSK